MLSRLMVFCSGAFVAQVQRFLMPEAVIRAAESTTYHVCSWFID